MLSKFYELTGAFGAFQDMKVFGVGEIKDLRGVDPSFQGGVVDASLALRVRIPFEYVLLELLEKQRIIVIIL